LQARVRLNGTEVRIGGTGIQADLVTIRAEQLSTLGDAVIVARMPFNNITEASTTLPALTLDLAPSAFAIPLSFASAGGEIAVNVGSRSFGNTSSLPFDAGLIEVLPLEGAQGSTAVFLKGPEVGSGYTMFSTASGTSKDIPVFYNGQLPSTPEVSGAISAAVAVVENARRQAFEESIRSENVATRLRAGVIAEVGPGRSVTTGAQGAARPMQCASPADCAAK
jgi:hypothetical protein